MLDLLEGVLGEFAQRAVTGFQPGDIERCAGGGLLLAGGRILDNRIRYLSAHQQRTTKYQLAIAARRCSACDGKLARPYREKAKCLTCGADNFVPSLTRRVKH